MRREDWTARYAEFAKDRASMPFEWGPNDCCSFAAAGVEALTGANPMASAERYDSALGAARLTNAAGGLLALAASFLGEPVSPRLAAVGDVVLLSNDGRELLGVCNGVNALAPGAEGSVTLEMSSATAAWKI